MAVNVTDKVDKATVEKAIKSPDVNKHRFSNQTQELQGSLALKACSDILSKCFEWKTSAVARS